MVNGFIDCAKPSMFGADAYCWCLEWNKSGLTTSHICDAELFYSIVQYGIVLIAATVGFMCVLKLFGPWN